jgi:subtilisin-like proprotein convertase family protein
LKIALTGDPANAAVVSAPLNSFTLPNTLPNGSSYSVTVSGQPKGLVQTCSVSANGSGTIAGANVTNVTVTCSPVSSITYTQSVFLVDGVQVTTAPAGIPDSTVADCTSANPGKTLTSEIVVPSSPFAVRIAKVTLNGLNHTWVGDLTVIVEQEVGPANGRVIAASRPMLNRPGRVSTSASCGSSLDLAGNYTFTDGSGSRIVDSSAAGTHVATGTDDVIVSLNEGSNGGFGTATPAGTWRLKIVDNNLYDTGTISSWTLTLLP